MVDIGTLLSDPFTLRTIFSVLVGAVTGLLVVRLTFHLHNQRDLFKSVRATGAELEFTTDQLAELSRLLRDDMRDQHVDLPIEVPAGTVIEVRYVLTLPCALNTSAFDQLRRSGRLVELPGETRRDLFALYDAIDRINRLRLHRETLHYGSVGHVHVVIDHAELGVEAGTTATEAEFPPDVREQLSELRRMRRATRGINEAILRLVATISSAEQVADMGLERFAEAEPEHSPDPPTVDGVRSALDDVERRSFWARFV